MGTVAEDRDVNDGHRYTELRAGRDVQVAGRDVNITYQAPPPSPPPPTPAEELRGHLEQVVESYKSLELLGIPDTDSMKIDLEKVYIALKAQPETAYDLHHEAALHTIEVREAAGGLALDQIDSERLDELDADNIRRTYRPRREESRLAGVADVQNIADAFCRHHRMVLLGNPGSGKTTLGHWLVLQMARGALGQLPAEVRSEDVADLSGAARLHVRAGYSAAFTRAHFTAPDQTTAITAIGIDELPVRGKLMFKGVPIARGQVVKIGQVGLLTFTPAPGECGSRYAHLRYVAGGLTPTKFSGTVVIDVGRHVEVPAGQVDPDLSSRAETGARTDLGPVRVPIFLRVAHYARDLAERKDKGLPARTLEQFLGRDPDSCGLPDGLTPERRNALLCEFLQDGQAVVVFDGLDELSEANRRTVLADIDEFINAHTRENLAEDADESGTPLRAGGNQVVVTSRYVGYRNMSLQSGCAHFGIQPMGRQAVEHFVRSWVAAVNGELATRGRRQFSAEDLIAEIYDDARPRIRELATNPLLISILAIVYLSGGRLPEQRAGVYDRVVENLLQVWLNRPECQQQLLVREELLAALQPLAADMQGNSASNSLINLDRIRALIEVPLAESRDTTPDDAAFRPVLEALLTTIQKQVGLLAEQSAGNFAFFHRTFQEFLAARHLLADREHAAADIIEHLDDPQWREPLLLSLGLVMGSEEWDEDPEHPSPAGQPEYRVQLLEDVLAGDERGTPIPRAALLVMNALPGLTNVPRPVLARLIGQLLHSYAFTQGQARTEGLRDSIHGAFASIHTGPAAGLAAEVIADAIRQPSTEADHADHADHAGAAAQILLRLNWFTTEIVEALLHVAHTDQDRLGWPVRWAILAALGQPAGDPSWSPAAPELDRAGLVSRHLPMRRLLESQPELLARVQDDADWLWVLMALYGGLGRTQTHERLRADQNKRLRASQSTNGEAVGAPPVVPPVEFSPCDIVQDLEDRTLSSAIQQHLGEGAPSAVLADVFRRAWLAGSAEALVGLAALGEDVVPVVGAALADRDRGPAARAVLTRFRWLAALLREPILRASETAARTIPEAAPQEHQLDLLRVVIRARAVGGAGPLAVSDTIPAHRHVAATSPEIRSEVDGEYWAYLFSGLAAEGGDILDGALLPESGTDAERLVRGWSAINRAHNLRAGPRLPWPREELAPRPGTLVEHYLTMLDEIQMAPRAYDHHAGLLLGRCKPLLLEHPALIWETLAVCCSRGRQFMRGYVTGATGQRPMPSAAGALAADLVGEESTRRILEVILGWGTADGTEAEDDAIRRSGYVLVAGADTIDDPYLRFRALWKSVWYSRTVPFGLDIDSLIAEITDPQHQARAIEWLLTSVPDKKLGFHISGLMVDTMARLSGRITDPENRARAQARLAFIVPEQPEVLLGAAAASLADIADPRRRAEAILDLRSAVGGLAGVADDLDAAAGALPEQWLRDKAHGRDSRLVAQYRTRYGVGALAWRLPPEAPTLGADSHRLRHPTGRLAWGALYLNAVAAEVGALDAAHTGDRAGWEMLRSDSDTRADAGVAALIESAADGGLRVTAVEATFINRLICSGRAARLQPLWSYLEAPDAGATAIIARWPTGEDAVQRWRALIQMEGGRLTPENVGPVVELLSSSQDRLRLRAALALHGTHPFGNNRNRRWSVTRVGTEAINALAGQAARTDLPPSVLSVLSWTSCDIHHDDAEALSRWLSAAAAGGDAASVWLLENLESIDEELVEPLLAALRSAPPDVRRPLLQGLTRVGHTTKVLDGVPDALREAVAAVPLEIRREVRVIPKGPVSILEAVEAATTHDPADRLDIARSSIEQAMLWLDEQRISDGAVCLATLKSIGYRYYVQVGRTGYFAEAREAAASLAENEDALRLLLQWAESVSRSGDPSRQMVAVMAALEAVARISPKAFAALADPNDWETMLIEWVATSDYWVGRVAAVRLLGMLRLVTDLVADALRIAMKDNVFVQRAAYAAVSEFRMMKDDVIPRLLELLADPSAGVVASATRLLLGLARGEGAPHRRLILRGLQDAVAGPSSAVPVYLMRYDEDGSGGDIIEYVDRLDRILYLAIFEVTDS